MTGRSFLRVLRGEPFEGRQRVFAERGAHGSGLPTTTTAFDLARCVVTRTHKLIYNALWAMPYEPVDFANGPVWKGLKELNAAGRLPPKLAQVYFPEKRPLFELYDLEKDPAELDNLSGKSETAELEHTLKTALQEWMILERDYLPLPLPAGQARPAAARARQRAGSP
jgi:arylsulfatase A-like enzyme